MQSVTLQVKGMTCAGCVASVTRVLRALPGVGEVSVLLQPGTVHFTYDAQHAGVPAFKRAIEEAGYEVAA